MINISDTPHLRFPGYKKEWTVKKLGAFGDVSKLAGYEFTKHIVYSDHGKYIGLRGLNIKRNTLDLTDVKYIDQSDLTKLSRSKIYKDDLMFTYVGTIGEVALITENDKYYLAPNVARVRINKNISYPKFVNYYFANDNFKRHEIKKYIASSSQPALSMTNIRLFRICLPEVGEQQKIASFLTEVDAWIENLLSQKRSLESYKKGIMQKIFSKIDKEYSPVKLGEVATFSKGDGISKGDIEINGKNKCVRYGELYTTYGEAIDKVVSRTDQKGRKFSEKNDVLMPTSDVTPSGLATASAISESGVILGGDIMIIRSIDIKNIYLSYYLRYSRKKIMKLVNGVTVYHLYSSDLAKLDVSYPPGEQQEKIAEFLTSIDKVIESKSTQITYTEAWKKGLLQQMFV